MKTFVHQSPNQFISKDFLKYIVRNIQKNAISRCKYYTDTDEFNTINNVVCKQIYSPSLCICAMRKSLYK